VHNYYDGKTFSSANNKIDQSDKDVSAHNVDEVALNKRAGVVQTFAFTLG